MDCLVCFVWFVHKKETHPEFEVHRLKLFVSLLKKYRVPYWNRPMETRSQQPINAFVIKLQIQPKHTKSKIIQIFMCAIDKLWIFKM